MGKLLEVITEVTKIIHVESIRKIRQTQHGCLVVKLCLARVCFEDPTGGTGGKANGFNVLG